MRRADREIKSKAEIIKIIEKCKVCRLAFAEGGVPYIVPMNFGFDYTDGNLVLYFHGANEGKKHNIIAKNPFACFEMDCSHKLIDAEDAANYSMEYESVIGNGIVSYITEKAEKVNALKRLMYQYAKEETFDFPDHTLDSVTVFKLGVSEFAGKRLKKS